MEPKKSSSDLAIMLRTLKPEEKKEFLTNLNDVADDYSSHRQSGERINPFSVQPLAFSAYYMLEGVPYTQPEFPSLTTKNDITARKKFNTILSGIVAYVKSSEEEKECFKKSVLRNPNALEKIAYLIKKHQKDRF